MKNDEQKEIGELLQEIASELWNLSIDVEDDNERSVWVNIFPRDTSDERGQTDFYGATIAEALGLAVDFIRASCGKPSRQEELEALIAGNEQHSTVLIQCGPDARCVCGSSLPLVFEKKYIFKLVRAWDNGETCFAEHPPEIRIEPGDIGTCLKCGKAYTFPEP